MAISILIPHPHSCAAPTERPTDRPGDLSERTRARLATAAISRARPPSERSGQGLGEWIMSHTRMGIVLHCGSPQMPVNGFSAEEIASR